MKESKLRKTALFYIAMAIGIAVSVHGGMKLNGSYHKKMELSGTLIQSDTQEKRMETLYSESPESAEFIEAGKKMGELFRDKEDKVVAIVCGNYKITENEVEMGLLLQEAFNNANNYEELKRNALSGTKAPQREAMLQELIKNYVLVGEAKRRGIVVTQEQARKYIDEQYALAEEALSQASEIERARALQKRALLDALVVGTGMLYEEYLQKIQIPGIVHQQMIEQLYNLFVEEQSADVRSDKKLLKAKYEAFEQKLMDEAEIIQLD